jgi:hypothetical protein
MKDLNNTQTKNEIVTLVYLHIRAYVMEVSKEYFDNMCPRFVAANYKVIHGKRFKNINRMK